MSQSKFRAEGKRLKAEMRKKEQEGYTPEEIREVLKISPRDLAALNRITSGKPPRNSMAILKAIELKMSYVYPKPKTEVQVDGKVNVSVEITRTVSDDEGFKL